VHEIDDRELCRLNIDALAMLAPDRRWRTSLRVQNTLTANVRPYNPELNEHLMRVSVNLEPLELDVPQPNR
jgi:hypothetical protein